MTRPAARARHRRARRARARRAARHRPRQRALAHRLHRLERRSRSSGAARAASSPTSATSTQAERGGRRRVGARDRDQDLLEQASAGCRPTAAVRLGFDDEHIVGQAARAAARARRPTTSSSSPPAASSRSCAMVKDAEEIERDPRRRAARRRGAARSSRPRPRRAHRARRRARPRVAMRRLRRAGRRRSRRSSPPARTARCRTRSRATSRSPRATLVVIDWGAQLDGYASDCTRTFATGEISTRDREVYELVQRAQAAALAAVRPGPTGKEVDAVAREIIDAAGHAEHFGHGLGHGVGPRGPRGAAAVAARATPRSRPGNVVTVEPGVYVAGRGRRAHRGPRRRHRGRPRRAQHAAEGPHDRPLIRPRAEGPPRGADGGRMAPSRLVTWLAGALVAWLVAARAARRRSRPRRLRRGIIFDRWVHVGVMAAAGCSSSSARRRTARERLGVGAASPPRSSRGRPARPTSRSSSGTSRPAGPVARRRRASCSSRSSALGGIVALACARVRGADRMIVADAAIAALAVGAVSAALGVRGRRDGRRRRPARAGHEPRLPRRRPAAARRRSSGSAACRAGA